MIDELRARGFFVARRPDWVASFVERPWEAARAICGEVAMVERQPIKPVPHGRSFASRTGDAPLHTDSQLFHGAPPDLQILACVRPAEVGGDTLLLDSRRVIERACDLDVLFRLPRTFRFVFGDLVATTISAVGDALIFTHPPRSEDPIALDLRDPTCVRLEAGDVIVVDNHRMLHGRTPFDDPRRELQRLLVWLPSPLPAPPELLDRARREGRAPQRLADREVDVPVDVMKPIVEEMLRGTPPGVLAIRHRVPEAHLYVYRDRLR
ncbi:MAG: TauD/TfdA family dioxygenase [Polyangiales bacterium]